MAYLLKKLKSKGDAHIALTESQLLTSSCFLVLDHPGQLFCLLDPIGYLSFGGKLPDEFLFLIGLFQSGVQIIRVALGKFRDGVNTSFFQ